MRILAIDTSGRAISAAVATDGRLDAFFYLRGGRSHAEELMPCIEAALAGLGLASGDFDAFAAITGPGSFTGLRIGISTVKAFAYAHAAPVVGVSALDALARNLVDLNDALICPLVDAKNGRVHYSIYKRASGGKIARLAGPATGGAQEAAAAINAINAAERGDAVRRVVFNGDAALVYIDELQPMLPNIRCETASALNLTQNAASAALLACEAACAGLSQKPEALVPNYMSEGYIARPIA